MGYRKESHAVYDCGYHLIWWLPEISQERLGGGDYPLRKAKKTFQGE